MPDQDDRLTALQAMILEVLVARMRLGEQVWTYVRRPSITKALKELQARGVIGYDSDPYGNWRVYFTDAGAKIHLGWPYWGPKERAFRTTVQELRKEVPEPMYGFWAKLLAPFGG